MSKLNDLIKKFCPDGVEYKKLETFATVIRGGNFQKKDFVESGKPCIHYGQMYTHFRNTTDSVLTYISEDVFNKSKQAEPNDIVMAVTSENVEDVCSCVAWLGKENVAVSGHTAIIHHNQNPSFLSYYFHSEQFFVQKVKLAHGTKVIEVTPSKLEDLEIPVPPLEIQNEIVRILDNFTELEEELEEELEARRKQYEYYRDSLLTFDDSVEWKTLEELCTKVTDGSHFSPKASEKGYPMPSVKDMRFNNFDLSNCKKISENDYNELVRNGCKPLLNDVLIAKDGSMLKYAFPVKEELDLVILSSIAILRPKTNLISPDYFAHYFRQDSFREIVIRDYSSKGGVPRIVLKNFKKIKIPVPTLEKQKQIVTILDRFEALCNDITSGLPAEIEARHKQYEYYRDKLLTFKRKSA